MYSPPKSNFFEVLFASQEKLNMCFVLSFFLVNNDGTWTNKVLLFQTNIERSSGLYYFFESQKFEISKFLEVVFFFLSSFKYCGPKNKCHIVLFGLRKHFQGITTATLIFAQFFQRKNILLFCSQKSKAKRKIFV